MRACGAGGGFRKKTGDCNSGGTLIMENVIEITGVTKRYGSATVLDNINVSFERGRIHGLIGRNGSGKTMLMKCICGFVPVTSGKIVVNGKIIGKDTDVPDRLGAIIENPGFLYNYSGYKNLKFLAGIKNTIGKQQIREAIEMVGLDPDSRKHVGKYSLGMKQRLGLAQAIMENPDILLLDEPMNGLDKTGVEEMRVLFKKLADSGKTIIMANHSAEDIEMLCDTVCEMDLGVLERVK
jgi:ABC-2 type transport system ATP-binding protein